MATFQAVKKAVTLSPTVRTLSSGVPNAPLVNLAAKAPAGHGHGHGASGPRSDVAPKWAGGVSNAHSGLSSKTYMNGKYACLVDVVFRLTRYRSAGQPLLGTALHSHLLPGQGRPKGP